MSEAKCEAKSGAVHVMGMRVENFCRIELSNIAPQGKTVKISGKNRQGKTSTCNALWVALGGADAMDELGITQPVRKGADAAKIFVDMGEILVCRELNPERKTTKLLVTTKDGFKLEPGQTVLNKFRGKFFDLSEFYRMDAKKRLELVLSLIDLGALDLAKHAEMRARVFEERKLVNREVVTLEGQVKGAPEVEAPDEEVSVEDIAEEMRQAQQLLDDNNVKRELLREKAKDRESCVEKMTVCKGAITSLEEQIKGLQARLEVEQGRMETLKAELKEINETGRVIYEEVQALVDPDMDSYTRRMQDVEKINQRVRAKQARATLLRSLEAKKEESQKLTVKIAAIDKHKDDAIKAARFPVDGMAFDDSDVTFNGVPFSQSSDMERLIIGYGIAKALSPKFKVLRLSRPGDLDPESMEQLLAMAEEDDMQLLIEQVSDGKSGDLIIEDGLLNGGTTEGVEQIVEAAKPKRGSKAKGAENKDTAEPAATADLAGIYAELAAEPPAGKAGKAAKESKPTPAAAPVEL